MIKGIKNYILVGSTFLVIIIIFGLTNTYSNTKGNSEVKINLVESGIDDKENIMYVGSKDILVEIVSDITTMTKQKIPRGTKVNCIKAEESLDENGSKEYSKIKYKDKSNKTVTAYIETKLLVKDKNDIVKENEIFIRTPTHVYSTNKDELKSLLKKGERLKVVGYDDLDINSGKVKWYKVKNNSEEKSGYVRSKYVVNSQEKANATFNENNIMDIHNKRDNKYGAGEASNLDFFPREKSIFKKNVMPKQVNAFYINSGAIKDASKYIEITKGTKINAFVVDIKDNTTPAYPAEAMKKYSPTNFEKAKQYFNTEEEYKAGIKKLKDAGFYVIGRITVFKDAFYVKDHPEHAIVDTRTNKPFLHNKTHWPSVYQRDVWEFNVELAKESVKKFGFNEIQFDYIRFPDRTRNYEKSGQINFKNQYEETKSQAVQRFIMYATDELHDLEVYVAGDVFGESAHTYVTPYGQYWGAISNVLDVISPMAYPDHFWYGDYGFDHPWLHPYEVIKVWSKMAVERQKEIPTPAVIRPWIQNHNATKNPKKAYNANEVLAQLRAYNETKISNGFMTWWSSSSIDGYQSEISAYKK
jgi:hypothetical protein